MSTRRAMFAACKNVPWRLRPHAHKHSGGSVTDADCDLVDSGRATKNLVISRNERD